MQVIDHLRLQGLVNILNDIMKRDYIIGMILGVALTFIGVFIQFRMNKDYENTKIEFYYY